MTRTTDYSIDEDGWLRSAEIVASPNFNERPEGTEIRLIVVHGISLPPGQYGGAHIRQFFCNRLDENLHPYFAEICHLQVSAHCLVERDGHVVQFVSFLNRAWHAGESSWCGESGCNDFSVGIELEGTDDNGYTEEQYRALAGLVSSLRKRYPGILADCIAGHSDIAPGRKTDPGPSFDWNKLKQLVA